MFALFPLIPHFVLLRPQHASFMVYDSLQRISAYLWQCSSSLSPCRPSLLLQSTTHPRLFPCMNQCQGPHFWNWIGSRMFLCQACPVRPRYDSTAKTRMTTPLAAWFPVLNYQNTCHLLCLRCCPAERPWFRRVVFRKEPQATMFLIPRPCLESRTSDQEVQIFPAQSLDYWSFGSDLLLLSKENLPCILPKIAACSIPSLEHSTSVQIRVVDLTPLPSCRLWERT